jgi:putative molybdopterin biosynthesis protein
MQIKIKPTVFVERKTHEGLESIDLTWVATLLRGVQGGRSLQSAAELMDMSYRTLWNRLKAAEKALDCRLMKSVKGHGSTLTDSAATLLQIVDEVELGFTHIDKAQERLFQERLLNLENSSHKRWLLCASNDPVLESAINNDLFELRTMGSGQSLDRLIQGEADLAGFHVQDDDSIQTVRKRLSAQGIQAYPVMRRTQGLLLAKGNPFKVKSLKDLVNPKIRFINRQRGAGTRLLFDKLLKDEGISPDQIQGYQREEFTHTAVATAILAKIADVGVGVKSVAIEHGLDFIALGDETYFLAMSPQMVKRSAVSELIRLMRESAKNLDGYEEVKLRQKKKVSRN